CSDRLPRCGRQEVHREPRAAQLHAGEQNQEQEGSDQNELHARRSAFTGEPPRHKPSPDRAAGKLTASPQLGHGRDYEPAAPLCAVRALLTAWTPVTSAARKSAVTPQT